MLLHMPRTAIGSTGTGRVASAADAQEVAVEAAAEAADAAAAAQAAAQAAAERLRPPTG